MHELPHTWWRYDHIHDSHACRNPGHLCLMEGVGNEGEQSFHLIIDSCRMCNGDMHIGVTYDT